MQATFMATMAKTCINDWYPFARLLNLYTVKQGHQHYELLRKTLEEHSTIDTLSHLRNKNLHILADRVRETAALIYWELGGPDAVLPKRLQPGPRHGGFFIDPIESPVLLRRIRQLMLEALRVINMHDTDQYLYVDTLNLKQSIDVANNAIYVWPDLHSIWMCANLDERETARAAASTRAVLSNWEADRLKETYADVISLSTDDVRKHMDLAHNRN